MNQPNRSYIETKEERLAAALCFVLLAVVIGCLSVLLSPEFPMRKILTLTAIGYLLLTLTACGLIRRDPTQPEIQQVRAVAIRIADSVGTAEQIANAAGQFISQLPITNAQKNEYDCAVVKVMGTSTPRPALLKICGSTTPQGPGPIPKLLTTLKNVATHPELRATVAEILAQLDPLIKKLESSTEPGIVALAIGIRAATTLLVSYLGGGL